ncbi:unnamed protein product, partial [Closterium sp. NIES-54]
MAQSPFYILVYINDMLLAASTDAELHPALLPPQSWLFTAAAPVAALPCCRPGRGPDLNHQLRPCPAPAP